MKFQVTKLLCITTMVSLFSTITLAAHPHHDHGASADSPIGIMGDHTHDEGDWMFSYRFMTMEMDGNKDGSSDVDTAGVLKDFIVAPLRMDMEMHMFGAMYTIREGFSVMAMLPFIEKEMDHVTRMGALFTTETSGWGDLKLSGTYVLNKTHNRQLILNAGISLPTGGTEEKGLTPVGVVRLPYPMQLGSGTFDLLPGITWLGSQDGWSWGTQASATLRTGSNNGYSLGDRLKLSAWGELPLTDAWSVSLRITGETWDDIDGQDDDIAITNPGGVPMVPTADPDLRGGSRVDGIAGMSFKVNPGLRVGLELGWPIQQNLDGPQLETGFTTMFGVELI